MHRAAIGTARLWAVRDLFCVGFHRLSSLLCLVQKCSFIFKQRSAEMPSVIVQLVCFCLVPKCIFLKKSARFSWLLICSKIGQGSKKGTEGNLLLLWLLNMPKFDLKETSFLNLVTIRLVQK